jgi:putative hydrolase of the HAD superfamily
MTEGLAGRFAVWLMPCERDRVELRKTIRRLAGEHGAPAFEPHVTVFAGSRASDDEVGQLLLGASAGVGPLVLRSTGYGLTADFFKTVFITFERDRLLERVSRNVGRHLRRPQDYDLQPHLSLIYADLAETGKRAIIAGLDPPKSQMAFDEVVVARPGPTNDWRDVASWSTEFSVKLDGRSP